MFNPLFSEIVCEIESSKRLKECMCVEEVTVTPYNLTSLDRSEKAEVELR